MNRERIEEIRHTIIEHRLNEYAIDGKEMLELLTLALRGLGPMVEWRTNNPGKSSFFHFGNLSLTVTLIDGEWFWELSHGKGDCPIKQGTADSLEAAQKAAEDALANLVGGEG